MSIFRGEVDSQHPEHQDEEEKVDGFSRKEKQFPSESKLLIFRDENQDVTEDIPQLHTPLAAKSPGHHPALPPSVHAPKPPSSSPVVDGELKPRPEKKNPFSSFLHSFPKPTPAPTKAGTSVPTISDEKITSSFSENYHHGETNAQRHHQHPHISAVSLVVCGVDGIVYTLDAYTGRLRGMFASGPALVFSSSPDAKHADKGNGVQDNPKNFKNGKGDRDKMNEHMDGDASNAITSNISITWKERVVPGLDGQLYSLLEMFDGTAPGEAGDDTHDFERCQARDRMKHDYLDGVCDSLDSQKGHARENSGDESSSSSSSNIIPHFGTYNLTPLPISAMDVVDSPISTCRPTTYGDAQRQQCGIIVGSKKTTIYAIDPITGKMLWTQDPMGGGGRGYTKHTPKSNSVNRGRTVLLQREDYAVRHLDTEGGKEVWKVELGRFSALDFDVDVTARGGRGGGHDQEVGSDDATFGGESLAADHVVGGRRRGSAAASASEKKKGGIPPLLGGRKKTSLHDFDSGFGDDRQVPGGDSNRRKEALFDQHEDHDRQSHFRGFPSVAFGEDGTRLMAVDGISGELLWKRRIESVVAAVYGVGKEISWIPLDVIDESQVFTHGHRSDLQNNCQRAGLSSPSSSSPTSTPDSGGLVPYGAGQMESGKLHRLGRHHSNLFVSSKFDPPGGYDTHHLAEFGVDGLPYVPKLDTPLPSQVNNHGHEFHHTEGQIVTMNPSEIVMTSVKPPPSHRTEHGLYLTWSMVAAIVMTLLSIVVFIARVIILRQKRKWENTPSLDPTTAPTLSEDGKDRSQSSDRIYLPPAATARNLAAPSVVKLRSNNKHPPSVTRSFSLNALGSNFPGLSSSNNAAPQFLSEASVVHRLLNLERGTSTPTASAIAMSPIIMRSSTLPSDADPSNDKLNQQQSRPGVDSIDGIPLVRYSRYRSEFEEMSALGRGGFGTVFQCKNTLDSREYAIKKIKIITQLGTDGTATKHFSQKLHRVLREVKILALLDHPNIVRYYTAWLEVDDSIQNEDDGTNTMSSILDRKSHGVFSSSLFSGFGSNSRAIRTPSFGPEKSVHSHPTKGFLGSCNPLGWNNFRCSFRLDESQSESSSYFGTQEVEASIAATCEEDLGFTWERSNEKKVKPSLNDKKLSSRKPPESMMNEDNSNSSSNNSANSQDMNKNTKYRMTNVMTSRSTTQPKCDAEKSIKSFVPNKTGDGDKMTKEGRHILFIQMQLCSSQTLADFLENRQARCGPVLQSSSPNASYAVDIPFALRLFSQIANGVKYVHKQGLIHRDLKPQNCFIDDAGNVKVGDFGLSRESSTAGGITDFDENGKEIIDHDHSFVPPDSSDAENTAGVGTRAYASPEQMRGSNYDASTDVYSLGIILFELCYPMYTTMEKYQEFGGIRKGVLPKYWNSHVKIFFPALHDLLVQMISESAAGRPSASAVLDHVESVLREYSVQSLDKSWGKKGALLLRVETDESEGILADAMKLIKVAAPDSTILQYGLRGQDSRAIMEFAVEIEGDKTASVERISSRLHGHAMTVRQISNSW